MPRSPYLVLLAAALVLPGAASAANGRWPALLHAALAESGTPREAVSLYVQEVGAHEPILAWNAGRAMNPASTMKLVTTLAALEVLGPTYTWRTEVYAQGPVLGDVLHGDLVLKGYGDPKLTLENFWLLLRDVRARGLREIRGELVLDRSFFAPQNPDPPRFDSELMRPYNVPPDALLLNFKSVRLQFVPQEDSGTVKIVSTPHLPQIEIVNQLALGAGHCDFWPERPQALPEQARLVFTGVFPSGCGEKSRNFALLNPNDYALTLFQQLWRELGGAFAGGVREGAVAPEATLLATWESPPLAEVIRDINKFSNNVMARQLFLTLSLAVEAPPLSTSKAARAVREWARRVDLDLPELVIENGSGLSRIERISARGLARVLLRAMSAPLMPEYLASLPIPGIDGTLRRRLNASPASGQAHIKTGYLDGVRAIAGYVLDQQGRWLVVVAIINHPSAINAQGFQDAVIEWAYSGEKPGRCCGP
jgi:D-alanyl-D-alanine carboxypeptidase/D-alanyl-D-alanine-endopeptidase (penicillin-binding protein 4)